MSVLSNLKTEGCVPAQRSDDRSALSRFWRVLRENGWAMVKINLLTLIFVLPAIVWHFLVNFMSSADALLIPYSANIGIGVHIVTDAVSTGVEHAFKYDVLRWLVMIPLMMIAFIGLAGSFYTMKTLIRGEDGAKVRVFFRGIKKCWLWFLVASLPISALVSALAISVCAFPVYTSIPTAIRVLVIVGISLLLFIAVLFAVFATAQAMTYDFTVGAIMKNASLFSVALIHRSIVVLALCALPVVLALVMSQLLAMLFVVFFMLIGISFIVLMCSVYTQWAFDRFIEEPLRPKSQKKSGKYTKRAK